MSNTTDSPAPREFVAWFHNLRGLAHAWSEGAGNGPPAGLTQASIDLLFAYGLARLGEIDASRKLVYLVKEVLDGGDEAHRFLLKAYGYRIKMAQEGKRNSGPLPAEDLHFLDKEMERGRRYLVES